MNRLSLFLVFVFSVLFHGHSFAQQSNITSADSVLVDDDLYFDDFVPDSARYMLNCSGMTFYVGADFVVAKNVQGYSALFEALARFAPIRLSAGLGVMPGVRSRSVPHRQAGAAVLDASGAVYSNVHPVEESSFVLPLFLSLRYELLRQHVSPALALRLGTQYVHSDHDGFLFAHQSQHFAPYFHAHLGCRVALSSVSVLPYVGCSADAWPGQDDASPRLSFGFLVGF